MDGYSSAYARRLAKAIDEMILEKAGQITGGFPKTFDDYRERVGELRSLGAVREAMRDIEKKLNGDEPEER